MEQVQDKAPKSFPYRDTACWAPNVYAVDDAWFEGDANGPLFARLQLGGLHKQRKAVSALVKKLNEQPGEIVSAGAAYLRALATTCQTRGFHLDLCNFEWLPLNWEKVNVKGNALLLDINYANGPADDLPHHDYGLRLIQRLLGGERPQADIFIVSSWPLAYENAKAHNAGNADWWQVWGLQVVEKSAERMATDLDAFAANFQQRNRELPDVELLRSLLRASADGWGHPNEFEEVPRDLALRDMYRGSLAAIRALYHQVQIGSSGPDYAIPCQVLTNLLASSGYSFSEVFDGKVRLPWAPYGVFWVVKMWSLLRALREGGSDGDRASLRVVKDQVQINIPLNPNGVEALDRAVRGTQRPGTSAKAYLDLKSNLPSITPELLNRMWNQEPQLLQALLSAVKVFETVTLGIEKGPHPSLIVRWNGAIK